MNRVVWESYTVEAFPISLSDINLTKAEAQIDRKAERQIGIETDRY